MARNLHFRERLEHYEMLWIRYYSDLALYSGISKSLGRFSFYFAYFANYNTNFFRSFLMHYYLFSGYLLPSAKFPFLIPKTTHLQIVVLNLINCLIALSSCIIGASRNRSNLYLNYWE